jgi:hypothetical protein
MNNWRSYLQKVLKSMSDKFLAWADFLYPDANANTPNHILLHQKKCRHLKGRRRYYGIRRKDYAIRDFTFIDGTREVACLICGKKWRPDHRNWSDALEMLESTTNTSSSSERPLPLDGVRRAVPVPPASYIPDGLDIGDANPIKGLKKATKLNPEEVGPGGFIVFNPEEPKSDTVIL